MTMLRLLLALILAFAASPMPVAACEQAMPMAMDGHATGGMDHKAPMAAEHVCVGCIAVADWDSAPIVPPVPVATLPLAMRVAALPLLPGKAPTPPPPRSA